MSTVTTITVEITLFDADKGAGVIRKIESDNRVLSVEQVA